MNKLIILLMASLCSLSVISIEKQNFSAPPKLEIFPDRVQVKISFFKVKPNLQIFIDSDYYKTTSAEGGAEIIDYFKEEHHQISLRDNNKIIVSAFNIQFLEGHTIKCSGVNNMLCINVEEKSQ